MRRRRWILAFLAVALAGLAVRQLSASMTFVAQFFDPQDYEATFSSTLFWGLTLFGPLLATVLVAAVAGYVSPRGFWLWGLATACLRPVEQIFQQIYFWYFRYPYLPSDVQEQANEPPDYSFYVVLLIVETMTFLLLAVACTVSASAGAGLRLLVRRLSGRSEPAEDEEAGLAERGGMGRRFAWISWRAVAVGSVVAFLVGELLRSVATGLLLGTYPWEPADPELGASVLGDPIATLVPVLIVSALLGCGALLLGGYLAGRHAGRRGGSHGLMVAGGFLLLTVVAGIVSGVVVGLPGGEVPADVDPASINLAALLLVPLIAFVVSLLLIFLGGYLGGRIGERYTSGAGQAY